MGGIKNNQMPRFHSQRAAALQVELQSCKAAIKILWTPFAATPNSRRSAIDGQEPIAFGPLDYANDDMAWDCFKFGTDISSGNQV